MTPNPPAVSPVQQPVDRQKWAAQLQVPGIILCALAGLNVLLYGMLTPVLAAETITGRNIVSGAGAPPAEAGAVIGALVVALLHVVALFGAIQLARARSKAWSNFAAIAAMLPCGPCCVLGLPIGIWALVTINKAPPEIWDEGAAGS